MKSLTTWILSGVVGVMLAYLPYSLANTNNTADDAQSLSAPSNSDPTKNNAYDNNMNSNDMDTNGTNNDQRNDQTNDPNATPDVPNGDEDY